MKTVKISDLGKDFNGNKLNEDNIPGFAPILYKNKLYRSGNRRHFAVELIDIWGNFYKTVDSRYIRLVDLKFNY